MSRLSYYVYYRVAPGAEPGLRQRVRGMQESLAAQTGVRGRLLVRQDDPLMWMEVYEAVPDGPAFEAALGAAEAAAGIAALLAPGEARHVERFRALPGEASEPC